MDRDKIEYAIYGIIEPYTNKIVYISYTIYNWNDIEKYPESEEIIKEAIDGMKYNNNSYWRDLNQMYYGNIDYNNYNKVLTGVVVLEDYYEIDKESDYLGERLNYWRNLFKPRYNIGEYEEDTYSEADKYIKNGWLKYNGKEWVFTSPELEDMWYGVDEDSE